MTSSQQLILAAFVLGLFVTLVLAAWLTPSRWWQRPTLRNLAIVGAGTWGIGSLLLALLDAPVMAATASVPANTARSYRVHEDLNLRAAIGTGAARIAVVPAGTVVTTTGVRDGDWWQVRTSVNGKPVQGWSSSLWLRRADEAKN